MSIVSQLYQHRLANPHLAAQHNWRTDMAGIEDEVDEFNARICLSQGWTDYIVELGGGSPPPKLMPQLQKEAEQIDAAAGRAKKIWSGVKTLNEWIDSDTPPVSPEVSARRAAVCAGCPKNTQGDFTSWFTKPAAAAIKKQVERVADRKLSTPDDARINVCDVCLCPLKLKVHTPLPFIKANMSDAVIADLQRVGGCWIISELAG